MIPDNIARAHMLRVIREFDQGVRLVPDKQHSTKFCLAFEGRHYPPKIVIRWANEIVDGEELWEHSGGRESNSFCESRGFSILEHGGAPY